MTAEATPEIRHPGRAERASVAVFIARQNGRPENQCLHCAEASTARVDAALESTFGDRWEQSFIVASDSAGRLTGVAGCQLDAAGTGGWLWGPWMDSPAAWDAQARSLLDRLIADLPRPVRTVDAFLHSANRSGLRFLAANGFSLRAPTHIYVAPASVARGPAAGWPAESLGAMHEVGFAALHAASFPAASSTAAELLAERDEEHHIFAVADGLRLLGYVCVSVNHAPREGFIDYLAVKPAARGRGIGGALLRRALRWAGAERRLPQVALCVSDWRAGARKLYQAAGFSLSATGIGAARRLRAGPCG